MLSPRAFDRQMRRLTTATFGGNTCNGSGQAWGFVFVWWKGDHAPRHVHVYREGQLVVKWDLDNWQPMKGEASRQLLELITGLVSEGLL